MLSAVGYLSDQELLDRVKHLAECERKATASLIAHLAELDERRLYLGEGYSSLFVYCTQVLHLSEHAAYGRIEAARAVRRFPVLLDLLDEGAVNLTTVGLLAAHLTPENHREVLDIARYKSKRQVEELVAKLHPQPPVAASVRRLPTASRTFASPSHDAATSLQPTNGGERVASPAPLPPDTPPPRARPAVVTPLAPQCYRVQFMASAETIEKLRLAQDLLRHQIPDGEPAAIFDRALTAWSSITSCRMPPVANQRQKMSSSGAVRTMATKQRCILVRTIRSVYGRCPHHTLHLPGSRLGGLDWRTSRQLGPDRVQGRPLPS